MEGGDQSHKKTLCRFYLRGLCVYSSDKCNFSHGIWDLKYDYRKEGEYIEYDYHKTRDDVQKNIIKGPRIYSNLYEFQTEKVFSLAEIHEARHIRNEIRNLMHQQLYQEFMELLEVRHPGTPFTEEFLLGEFTRVGFNKILMGVMKFSHVISYLCEAPGSKYFKTTKVVPPHPKKVAVLARKATDEQIIAAYKDEYAKIVKKQQGPLEQTLIKKQLFTANLPENVPPLNLVMKDKKVSFADFISKILKEDTASVIFQASLQTVHEAALQYLKERLPDRLITWNDIYIHLTKVLKTNNGNVLNQVKPGLALEHNLFLFFPMVQFVFNSKLNAHIFKGLGQPCKCPYQKPFSEQELLIDLKNIKELKEEESYDINDFESLMMCAPHILGSEILGVDLEGNLRKGGFVEMIQLNNGRNTFLIDIWDMNEKGDFQTFWLARKIIRNVMVNPKIVKIFHDCRHDSVGLHEMIETCVVNVFDTSASETLIHQLNLYKGLFTKEKDQKELLADCKTVIGWCTGVKTPGLNEILKKYQARHGVNENKDKFHKMWSKGETSFFCKRPINPQYRDYCIRDVLDLPEVHKKMLSSMPEQAVDIAYWVSGLYAQSGYQPE